MKALLLNGPNQKFSLENINDPKSKKGFAIAKVLACGSGLTIQHVKSGRLKADYPIIIGHEIVAEIIEINDQNSNLKIGMPVTAYFYLTCGNCKWCRLNRETLCLNFNGYIGRQINGGYAEYISLPVNNFIPIPDGIDYKKNLLEVAVICDAIATPLKVIKKGRFTTTDKVGVIGAGGGLGIHMLKMLKLKNIEAIAIESKEFKHEHCNKNGSIYSISPNNKDIHKKINELTEENQLDGIIDFVSSKSTLELGVSLLGNGGRLLTLGGNGKNFVSNSNQMLQKELELIGSKYCSKEEVIESLNLFARGLINPVISKTSNFEGAETLHKEIENGQIIGRAGLIF
jgi:propanol-preferring alcohol dehydrogenase